MELIKRILDMYSIEYDELEINGKTLRIDDALYSIENGCSLLKLLSYASTPT